MSVCLSPPTLLVPQTLSTIMPICYYACRSSCSLYIRIPRFKNCSVSFSVLFATFKSFSLFCYRERKQSFPETSRFESQDGLQLPRRNNKENSEGSTNSSYSGVSFSREGENVFLRTQETLAGDHGSDSDYK